MVMARLQAVRQKMQAEKIQRPLRASPVIGLTLPYEKAQHAFFVSGFFL